jgi:hypothetical protein
MGSTDGEITNGRRIPVLKKPPVERLIGVNLGRMIVID